MAIKHFLDKQDLPDDQEESYELSLRPTTFEEYIGQTKIKTNLQLAIEASQKRNEVLDHILIYGSPGLGKTTLAHIIALEKQAPIKLASAPVISNPAELISIIASLKANDILFIDEIHRLNKNIEEVLHNVMEDFKLDMMLGKGISAKNLRINLPEFTLIGATTHLGGISAPLRDRFGHIHRLEFYNQDELATIIARSAKILKIKIDAEARRLLAQSCRLTPRIANRLLKRVRDYADVKNRSLIDLNQVKQALELLEIDQLGLDANDRLLLSSLLDNQKDGAVGLNNLSAIMGDSPDTIEDYYEPYLIQIGLMKRTPRGRQATPKARQHLSNR